MSIAPLLLHFLALLAPAWAVAAISLGLVRLVLRSSRWRMRWWVQLLGLGLLGSLVLLLGLLWTGEDGRIVTYAVLTGVVALFHGLALRPAGEG